MFEGFTDAEKGREVRDQLWHHSEQAKGDMDYFWETQERDSYDQSAEYRSALGVAMTLLDMAFPYEE